MNGESNQTILSKLDDMDGKLDTLVLWKAAHSKEHETVNRDIIELRTDVYGGDNSDGIKTHVQSLMNCKNNINKSKEFWYGILKLLIVAAVISLVTFLCQMYKGN